MNGLWYTRTPCRIITYTTIGLGIRHSRAFVPLEIFQGYLALALLASILDELFAFTFP